MGCSTSSLNVRAEKATERSFKSELKVSVKYRQGGSSNNSGFGSGGGGSAGAGGNFSPNKNSSYSTKANSFGSRNPAHTSANHSPKSTESTNKRNEDKIELIFKSKRENVYTAGVSLDNRINYHPKNIKKSTSQSKLISKYCTAAISQTCLFTQ